MKTRLNIICILIFVAIASSIADTVGTGLHDFLWGYQSANKEVEHAITNDAFISLQPNEVGMYTDSVYNTKTGEWMPLQYREVVVRTDINILSFTEQIILMLGVFIVLFLTIYQLVVFCKLIYAINKLKIFVWSNVLKLRKIGGAMLITFILNAVYKYLYYSEYVEKISIPDYTISSAGMWDFQQLIPGLGILLMGEIFAMGLRLREEQELTI